MSAAITASDCFERAVALHQNGQLGQALASYRRATEIEPSCAEAHIGCARVSRQLSRPELALTHCDHAIRLVPDCEEAHLQRGNALVELKQWEAALSSYDRAIELRPGLAEAHCNRGVALRNLDRNDAALDSFERSLALKPENPIAIGYRSRILAELRHFERAVASYDQAIALKPEQPENYSDRGIVLMAMQSYDAAVASFDRAIELWPDYPAAHFNRSLLWLLHGDLKHGWSEYEWRRHLGREVRTNQLLAIDRGFSQPRWLGDESLAGRTILLYCEQGLGDTLQFCRYVPKILALGATVILEVQRSLVSMMGDVAGRSQVVAKGDQLPPFDYHCPLMSLPLALKTNLDSVPSSPRYLSAQSAKGARWQQKLGTPSALRVGLVWRGRPTHRNDHFRSIPLDQLVMSLPRSGIQYVSLQKDVSEAEHQLLRKHLDAADFSAELHDFSDTAALCECLDLIISVDTSVAHLSGALGRNTWVLLPLVPDWRWLLDRRDSPWYPTMTLYRQKSRGDWSDVLAQVGSDLTKQRVMSSAAPMMRFERALALHQSGDLAGAQGLYEAIVREEPGRAEAINLLGTIALQTGDVRRAAELFGRAVALDAGNVGACCNRALALWRLGELEASLGAYDQAIELKDDLSEAHFNRGQVLSELRQFDAALASYRRAIELDKEYVEAYERCGALQCELGRWDAALAAYDQAIALVPDFEQAYFGRGNVHAQAGRWQAALDDYDRAIAIRQDYAEAYADRGNALLGLGRLESAVSSYRQALQIRPDFPEAHHNLGAALTNLRQWDDALLCYERAIALRPGFTEAHRNQAMLKLLLGDFQYGWQEYEWRRKMRTSEADRGFSQPLWLGQQSLAGRTILLYGEQGLGDTLQFCRYARWVAALGASVKLEVPGALTALLARLDGVSQVISRGEPLPDVDYQCALLSLPLAFKTRLDTIPSSIRYLNSDPAKVLRWQAILGERVVPRIGLAWSGNARHHNDRRRNIALAQLLAQLPAGPKYVSLQKDVRPADDLTLQSHPEILTFADELRDFSDTAALCECLDLVISVDTSIAHLSCALGKRTWILLPLVPDWRWLLDRADSPWYPTARLYRQEAHDGWNPVLERIGSDLLERYVTRCISGSRNGS